MILKCLKCVSGWAGFCCSNKQFLNVNGLKWQRFVSHSCSTSFVGCLYLCPHWPLLEAESIHSGMLFVTAEKGGEGEESLGSTLLLLPRSNTSLLISLAKAGPTILLCAQVGKKKNRSNAQH